MSTAGDLKSEIAQLKRDAEAPPRSRKPRKSVKAKPADAAPPGAQDTPDAPTEELEAHTAELKILADKLSDLVEDAETEIKERPIAMVLGAFALGVIVGALLRRQERV